MRNYKTIRIYINSPISKNQIIELDKNHYNYLKNVMRKKISDVITIFNGEDGQWSCEINMLDKNNTTLIALEQTKEQKSEPDIWLIFALVKSKNDFIGEKATELGVSKILPIISDHSVVSKLNINRLKANVIEASEQCERLTIPDVDEPLKLNKLLENWDETRQIIMCDESGGGSTAKDVLPTLKGHKFATLIGPEGGFSAAELAQLHKLPYVTPISMGARILKADTAVISALTLMQEHLGDFNEIPEFKL